MKFYEHTIIAKQDLSAKDLEAIKNKYEGVINNSSGKVLKTENWGLLSFVRKIKNYNKGHFIHYKFQGGNSTLDEIKKNTKIEFDQIENIKLNDLLKINISDEKTNDQIESEAYEPMVGWVAIHMVRL